MDLFVFCQQHQLICHATMDDAGLLTLRIERGRANGWAITRNNSDNIETTIKDSLAAAQQFIDREEAERAAFSGEHLEV